MRWIKELVLRTSQGSTLNNPQTGCRIMEVRRSWIPSVEVQFLPPGLKAFRLRADNMGKEVEMPYKDLEKKKAYEKEWHRKYNAERYALARQTIDNLKDVPCADCGVRYPPWVMDFDHVRDEKEFNIAKMTYQKPEVIEREAEKCDVVCSNCHRQRTHDRNLPL